MSFVPIRLGAKQNVSHAYGVRVVAIIIRSDESSTVSDGGGWPSATCIDIDWGQVVIEADGKVEQCITVHSARLDDVMIQSFEARAADGPE